MPKGTYDTHGRIEWIQKVYSRALGQKERKMCGTIKNYMGRMGPVSLWQWIKLWFRGEGRLWLIRNNEHVREIKTPPSLVMFKIDKTMDEFMG